MADLDPKVTLLRHKLALLIGEEHCPVYNTVKTQHPNALDEAWSSTMSEPYTLVGMYLIPHGCNFLLAVNSLLIYKDPVLNNKTFEMRQISTHSEAYARTFQPDPIDCGENIKLYR